MCMCMFGKLPRHVQVISEKLPGHVYVHVLEVTWTWACACLGSYLDMCMRMFGKLPGYVLVYVGEIIRT